MEMYVVHLYYEKKKEFALKVQVFLCCLIIINIAIAAVFISWSFILYLLLNLLVALILQLADTNWRTR